MAEEGKWKKRLIIILLLLCAGSFLYAYWQHQQSIDKDALLKKARAELEAMGMEELETGKPPIEDLPDNTAGLAVLEGHSDATVSTPVHDAPPRRELPPLPESDQIDAAMLRASLAACHDAHSDCQAALPAGAWILVSEITPQALGLACRSELARDPSGKVWGRVSGKAWFQMEGLEPVETEWREMPDLDVATVAKQEIGKEWMLETRLGVSLLPSLGIELGATWYGGRKKKPGPRRWGIWAQAAYPLTATTVSGTVSVQGQCYEQQRSWSASIQEARLGAGLAWRWGGK